MLGSDHDAFAVHDLPHDDTGLTRRFPRVRDNSFPQQAHGTTTLPRAERSADWHACVQNTPTNLLPLYRFSNAAPQITHLPVLHSMHARCGPLPAMNNLPQAMQGFG